MFTILYHDVNQELNSTYISSTLPIPIKQPSVITVTDGLLIVNSFELSQTTITITPTDNVQVKLTTATTYNTTTYATITLGNNTYAVGCTTKQEIKLYHLSETKELTPFEFLTQTNGYIVDPSIHYKNNTITVINSDNVVDSVKLEGMPDTDFFESFEETDYSVVIDYYNDRIYLVDLGLKLPIFNSIAGIKFFQRGARPSGSVYVPLYRKFYVTLAGFDSVVVIDSSDGSVTDTIPVGKNPSSIVRDTLGRIWIANTNSNTLDIIVDTQIIGTIGVGDGPLELLRDAVGNIWTTNSRSNTVTRVNFNSLSVTDVVVGQNPWGIAVFNNNIVVTNSYDNTISVINSTTAQVESTIDTGSIPYLVAVANNQLYVACYGTSTIKIYDTSFVCLKDVQLTQYPYGLTPDNLGNIWIADFYNSIPNRTIEYDQTCDSFSFLSVYGAALSSVNTSNEIIITGIHSNIPASIPNVPGVSLYKNNTQVVGTRTTVSNGDRLKIVVISSTQYDDVVDVDLTVGNYVSRYSVRTKAADLLVNPIVFPTITKTSTLSTNTSSAVYISGLTQNVTVPMSITNGSIIVNGHNVGSTAQVKNGDVVQITIVSSSSAGVPISSIITIGEVTTAFTVLTDPIVTVYPTPPVIDIISLTNIIPGTIVQSNPIVLDTLPDSIVPTVPRSLKRTRSLNVVSREDVVVPTEIPIYIDPLPNTYLVINGVPAPGITTAIVTKTDVIEIVTTSPPVNGYTTTVNLYVDGVATPWSVSTPPIHKAIITPFEFLTVAKVEPGTTVKSNKVLITWEDEIITTVPITITGGVLYVNDVAQSSTNIIINKNDTIQWELTTALPYGKIYRHTLIINDVVYKDLSSDALVVTWEVKNRAIEYGLYVEDMNVVHGFQAKITPQKANPNRTIQHLPMDSKLRPPMRGIHQLPADTTTRPPMRAIHQLPADTTTRPPMRAIKQLPIDSKVRPPMRGIHNLPADFRVKSKAKGLMPIKPTTVTKIPAKGLMPIKPTTVTKIPAKGLMPNKPASVTKIPAKGIKSHAPESVTKIPAKGLMPKKPTSVIKIPAKGLAPFTAAAMHNLLSKDIKAIPPEVVQKVPTKSLTKRIPSATAATARSAGLMHAQHTPNEFRKEVELIYDHRLPIARNIAGLESRHVGPAQFTHNLQGSTGAVTPKIIASTDQLNYDRLTTKMFATSMSGMSPDKTIMIVHSVESQATNRRITREAIGTSHVQGQTKNAVDLRGIPILEAQLAKIKQVNEVHMSGTSVTQRTHGSVVSQPVAHIRRDVVELNKKTNEHHVHRDLISVPIYLPQLDVKKELLEVPPPLLELRYHRPLIETLIMVDHPSKKSMISKNLSSGQAKKLRAAIDMPTSYNIKMRKERIEVDIHDIVVQPLKPLRPTPIVCEDINKRWMRSITKNVGQIKLPKIIVDRPFHIELHHQRDIIERDIAEPYIKAARELHARSLDLTKFIKTAPREILVLPEHRNPSRNVIDSPFRVQFIHSRELIEYEQRDMFLFRKRPSIAIDGVNRVNTKRDIVQLDLVNNITVKRDIIDIPFNNQIINKREVIEQDIPNLAINKVANKNVVILPVVTRSVIKQSPTPTSMVISSRELIDRRMVFEVNHAIELPEVLVRDYYINHPNVLTIVPTLRVIPQEIRVIPPNSSQTVIRPDMKYVNIKLYKSQVPCYTITPELSVQKPLNHLVDPVYNIQKPLNHLVNISLNRTTIGIRTLTPVQMIDTEVNYQPLTNDHVGTFLTAQQAIREGKKYGYKVVTAVMLPNGTYIWTTPDTECRDLVTLLYGYVSGG